MYDRIVIVKAKKILLFAFCEDLGEEGRKVKEKNIQQWMMVFYGNLSEEFESN